MSRLSEAAKEKAIAKVKYEEAKHEMLEAVLEVVDERGSCFARDIADMAGMSTRDVIGTIQSATRNGHLDSVCGHKTTVYVRLNEDGSVNLDERVIREYSANVYSISRRRR